jgi:hypothetical protein
MTVKIKSIPNFRCDITQGIIFKNHGEVFQSGINNSDKMFVIRVNYDVIGWGNRYDHAVEMLLREMKILSGNIKN